MHVQDATFADWVDMMRGLGMVAPRASFARVLTQIAAGPSWVFRADASLPPLALGGIVHGSECSEAWCVAGPGAASRMAGLACLARRLLVNCARQDGRPIIARVHYRNEAGSRMVAALGFKLAGGTGPVQIWWRL
jgi:hypothetical protein